MGAVGPAGPGAAEPHLLGGYHWDCSDWCGGGALPGISEVAGSERPDSSSPASPASPASRAHSPRRARDSDSAPDDADALRLTDGEHAPCTCDPVPRVPSRADRSVLSFVAASSYLLHTDEYCARATDDSDRLRARTLREPDAASLITMLGESSHLPSTAHRTLRPVTDCLRCVFSEERNSLLGGDDDGSGSELSANLCEIEESDAEPEPEPAPGARHTDV